MPVLEALMWVVLAVLAFRFIILPIIGIFIIGIAFILASLFGSRKFRR